MKVLFLTPNMASYEGASYQQDVATEMANQHEVFFYGPGFPGCASSDGIDQVLAKCPWPFPDCICVGHAWLSDNTAQPLERYNSLRLSTLNVPKVLLLNKEYVRLREKLDYIRDQRFDLVLTHHHDAARFQTDTGVRTVFWPFAADHRKFHPRQMQRSIDLFFSGILKNPFHTQTQNDVRCQAQAKLYHCLGDFRVCRRRSLSNYRICWNAFSGNPWIFRLDRALGRYRRIPDEDYPLAFSGSRVCFCSLSPLDLVSPRYFEAMASGAVVFCQRSCRYEGLFEDERHCVMFDEDLSDFEDALRSILSDESRWQRISREGAAHALRNHTWQRRVAQFERLVAEL